jgi:SAM-dependent methyltransferase
LGGDTNMPLSMEKRLRIISRHVQPGPVTRMLDCGCGSGGYVRLLRQKLGIDATGIEYLESKVAQAKTEPDVATHVMQGDIERLPFGDSEFDVVLLNEVLEHVPDDLRALQEIHRVLKPGGKLILFSPNRLFPFETHGVYLKGTDYKLPPWVPFISYIPVGLGKWVFRYWARNYWPSQLRGLLAKTGFQLLETDYVWQTFENISRSQLWVFSRFKRFFRAAANWCEKSFLKSFGVSQVLICQK